MVSFNCDQISCIRKHVAKVARRIRLALLLQKPFYVQLRSIRLQHSIKIDKHKATLDGAKGVKLKAMRRTKTIPAHGKKTTETKKAGVTTSNRMIQRCRTNRIKLLRRKKRKAKHDANLPPDANKRVKNFARDYMVNGDNLEENEAKDSEGEDELPYTMMELTKHNIGGPTAVCPHCQAIMWNEERCNKSTTTAPPEFSICCSKGTVKLPMLKDAPSFLRNLLKYSNGGSKAATFRRNIRAYNSMFAFTSIGAKIPTHQNDGSAPWVFTMYGQNHHKIGSLLPPDGKPPAFAQLYIYDTENEVENRKKALASKKKTTTTHGSVGVSELEKSIKENGASTEAEMADTYTVPEMKKVDEYEDETTNSLDDDLIRGFIKMLDENNQLCKKFRMWRDRYKKNELSAVDLRLISLNQKRSPQYNLPTSSEIAGLLVNDSESDGKKDIIVDEKGGGLKNISELHQSYMALQYPLLFPYGEDNFHEEIPYYKENKQDEDGEMGVPKKRKYVTMREYYAYRIQQRLNEGQTLIRGGRLFQQYVVDAYATIEQYRLNWVRGHQDEIRADAYKGIKEAVAAGDTTPGSVGRIVLPSSFTGGPRYMIQHYQDAIAICRYLGPPDLFLTVTCNPNWPEIIEALKFIPGQKPADRPDLVCRVFHIKLRSLMSDLERSRHFGEVQGAIYTVEFQKRGLPHAHILLWLKPEDKPKTAAHVDSIISAEFPDPEKDKVGYDAVCQYMLHGPCGAAKPKCPCMRQKKCTKKFPKKFCNKTTVDENGYPVYRRRNTGLGFEKEGIKLDNRWVVPHNLDLVVRYDCHINVEVCNCRGVSIKYLFKYLHKGTDQVTAVIEAYIVDGENSTRGDAIPTAGKEPTGNNNNKSVEQQGNKDNIVAPEKSASNSSDGAANEKKKPKIDEVKKYVDCRYISGPEAYWRTLNFEIHYRRPSVERLPFHLEGEQWIYHKDTDNLEDVLNKTDPDATKFLRWMQANRDYPQARKLTYADFPSRWIWDKDLKEWKPRKRGFNKIGRIYYVHPTAGEKYYLRILLNVQEGCQNYDDIKTVKGNIHPTFKAACLALGLLEDDGEWHMAIREAATFYISGKRLRELFVTILLNCKVTEPKKLWYKNWKILAEGIEREHQRLYGNPDLKYPEDVLKNYALQEIELIMWKRSRTLKEEDFKEIPYPDMSGISIPKNNLIAEETNYNRESLLAEATNLRKGLNKEQKIVFDKILESVERKAGRRFFVYGSGGTGKTYLWKTIICSLRAQGKIVLAVASSGIASLLLPGGRTAHSRFKIPMNLNDQTSCNVIKKTEIAELLCQADLIIWDEAPMVHRNGLEAVQRLLADLMLEKNKSKPLFGRKTIVLGGDFRQILPVIEEGSREEIVNASISRSKLWKYFEVYKLTKNMRLLTGNTSSDKAAEVKEFSEWVLDVGNGKLPAISLDGSDEKDWVQIPSDLLIKCDENHIETIVDEMYPNLLEKMLETEYLAERSILAPTNECVHSINTHILNRIPGEERTYLSADSIGPESTEYHSSVVFYDKEFLNKHESSGLASHKLSLKVGVPIMLLRNISQPDGLCNGTRLIVKQLGDQIIEAEVLTGPGTGNTVFIPRIVMTTSESTLPFILHRRQFPVKICYAMTINKSQGQSLPHVGVYLDKPVFSHGQLYVAVSRTTTRQGLKILIKKGEEEPEGYTQNIVYEEIFDNL